jgi:hypothetical protein
MKKIQKIKKSYLLDNKEFTTFENMKTYAYFNTGVGNTKTGYEMYQDEIIKEYTFKKQERRLLCEKIYDRDKELKKELEKRQLKLFTDG